ncbi:hypothetical protein EHV15_35350 [Paenibacillus oralis]|uniref:Uncharacterized protein n=1 Tax=Paenibacillus oralis TaxID=2490856 RepID=A0A3P3TA91_9BACL|nr:hypothetical protein [Paenibacillus oralis]RRJ54852.1 hypothetical protein EHV15_35350 [Paenibacillus oralis]
MGYDEVKFEEIESMTKEEAINELNKFFKGNKKFLEFASLMIKSTHGFLKINFMNKQIDTWNWEKLLGISISTKIGFKQLYYRKGNEKYKKTDARLDGNETHEIDGYRLTIYYTDSRKVEEFEF